MTHSDLSRDEACAPSAAFPAPGWTWSPWHFVFAAQSCRLSFLFSSLLSTALSPETHRQAPGFEECKLKADIIKESDSFCWKLRLSNAALSAYLYQITVGWATAALCPS